MTTVSSVRFGECGYNGPSNRTCYRPALRIILSQSATKTNHGFLIFGVIPVLLVSGCAVYIIKKFCWSCPQGGVQAGKTSYERKKNLLHPPPAFQEGVEESITLTLAEKHPVTYNTRRFIFDLPSPYQRLGVPIGKSIIISKKCLTRQYIPVNLDQEIGRLEIIVKIYMPDVVQGIPGGKFTQILDNLKIGDHVRAAGPYGCLWEYRGNGIFAIFYEKPQLLFLKRSKQVVFIAGGAGITPFLRVLKYCQTEGNNSPIVHLIFCNKTNLDIIERQYLEGLAKANPFRFHIYFVVDLKPIEEQWCHGVGFLNFDMVQKNVPEPSNDVFAMVCGPDNFTEHAVKLLKQCGYKDHRIRALTS